ncbi:hypothetical protein DSO57_1007246 [Entomophthora muscae]|uniref:Uncharacterized protein n=1 Tax=Entomophthora muscae TaxID=34485 RepID=A0ACC2UHK9_9FUNG|nr:hypothetical protein DSO57_1007246 [Entomophthora muscae]
MDPVKVGLLTLLEVSTAKYSMCDLAYITVLGLYKQGVRINNPPLENQAQKQDLNPNPDHLQAACPEDQRASHLHFSGFELLQAEVQIKSQSENTNMDVRAVTFKEELVSLPNRGKESLSVNFMNLKSSHITNQVPLPKKHRLKAGSHGPSSRTEELSDLPQVFLPIGNPW